MSRRLDVRRMLLARGWEEQPNGVLQKGNTAWVAVNNAGDSGVDAWQGARQYSVQFGADVPARVVVATAEAAAGVNTSKECPR